ncbi:MAG: hypothetical protein C4527_24795 [Candidatus Omnitrophota bacterium]|nr:MAG: hypothetical protein C4527_24795 [Candidatus Omnitrophota bacterium]
MLIADALANSPIRFKIETYFQGIEGRNVGHPFKNDNFVYNQYRGNVNVKNRYYDSIAICRMG